ncbi:MAG: FHA domain-containing protein [Ilumatobacter sp.]|nr:FHA domain-containing protein [Ilumatobacter sp.]
MTDQRVAVISGAGVVVRTGGVVVVIGRATVAAELIDEVKAAIGNDPGEDLARRVARIVLADDDPPALAVARFDGGFATVFLYGEVDLIWPAGRSSGAEHVLGVSRTVDRADGFTIALSEISDHAVEDWNDVEAGTLRGAGVVVETIEAPPEWTSPDADDAPLTQETPTTEPDEPESVDAPPTAETDADAAESEEAPPTEETPTIVAGAPEGEAEDDDAPFEAIELDGDVDLSDRTPLPLAHDDVAEDDRPVYERTVQVFGVYSPRGHFNHPDAKFCSRTGVKMGASMTKVLTEGPRPPLGVLTLDDGSTLTVRWDTVIGRDPTVDELVRTQQASPFVVSDLAQSVSRRHALLELINWDVFISDLGSRNSTYIQAAPNAPLRQLAVGERVALHSGTIVHLGKRSFVYNEHHVR